MKQAKHIPSLQVIVSEDSGEAPRPGERVWFQYRRQISRSENLLEPGEDC